MEALALCLAYLRATLNPIDLAMLVPLRYMGGFYDQSARGQRAP